ncbi:MAG: endonuclease, partial [Solirubrobacterales bacterium]|nr:endonuclease [Solirubrobacterales bacterium]
MLIGAHVSPAGGPAKAVERGVERHCRAIQIFNQNPRAWKPRDYSEGELDHFHVAMSESDVDALVIHAVYLINCASDDPEIREKSLTSLVHALRIGDGIG